MKFNRRQFFGFVSALGLSSCARVGLDGDRMRRVAAEIPRPSLPSFGKDSSFSFAAINDLHIRNARSTAIVNRAVLQINETPNVAFTVVLGDLGTGGTLQTLTMAKTALDGLEQPYLCVPGEHDVSPSMENMYENYERVSERQWRNEGLTSWAFIGLDTCNAAATEVTVPEYRMEWLERQLGRIRRDRPIALFTHHPFNPGTQAHRVRNADEVLALFEEHNLRLVASGHFHGNQVEERDGVLFTTTACCSSTVENFDGSPEKGYRLFHVHEGVLDHEFVQVRA